MTSNAHKTSLKIDNRALAQDIESVRKSYMLWLVIGIGLSSFAVTFALLYLNPKGIPLEYTVTFGAFLPSALLYITLNGTYRHRGRRILIETLSRAMGFMHRDDGCLAVSSLKSHDVLPSFNKDKSHDALQGLYQDVPVDIQETVLTSLQQTGKKKAGKEYVRFWGLLVRIKLRRSLSGHTVAIRKTAMQTFFRNNFTNYDSVKAGSGNFTKLYDVRSTDKVEAKMLLNSAFREKFTAAAKCLNAHWSVASFKDREILLGFQLYRPLFEATPLWKPVTEKVVRRYTDEISHILAIAAALKANAQSGLS